MYDKTKLGNRFTCFQCGTKFYDLNRPTPLCPECNADQNEAPTTDLKALLSKRNAAPKLSPIEENIGDEGSDDAEGDEFSEEAPLGDVI